MFDKIILKFQVLIVFFVSCHVCSQPDIVEISPIDFIHYTAKLEPNFSNQSVTGTVNIQFTVKSEGLKKMSFSAKYKEIFNVSSKQLQTTYQINADLLVIEFNESPVIGKNYSLDISYQAKPKRGMRFYPDNMFTVYSTNNWLVSHFNIADKASFEIYLTHNKNLTSLSNGQLISQTKSDKNNKIVSHWRQSDAMPVYTFGFVLGEFRHITKKIKAATFNYLFRADDKSKISIVDIKKIYADVPDMLNFFEQKSGFTLPNRSYSFVMVPGNIAQEVTGYSLVGENLGQTVLKDINENWFIAHELAHEWWGNSITCANFSHFWLNEGLVQYLVAAYKQHLFGQEAYEREIKLAIKRVKRAVKENRVSAVAFKHQISEKEVNHTMAYSKGALIFYMLREQLGDKIFWLALKNYSIANQGRSVTTQDLKQSFEKTSNQDLTKFFKKWVYGQEIPSFKL